MILSSELTPPGEGGRTVVVKNYQRSCGDCRWFCLAHSRRPRASRRGLGNALSGLWPLAPTVVGDTTGVASKRRRTTEVSSSTIPNCVAVGLHDCPMCTVRCTQEWYYSWLCDEGCGGRARGRCRPRGGCRWANEARSRGATSLLCTQVALYMAHTCAWHCALLYIVFVP